MTETIEVSVCIVNYNAGKYIGPCIESIYAKTKGLTFEIIIIDNKSTDGSLKEIKMRFPKVRILESDENVGFARACNKAASAAIGEYILFLNPDTELKNDAIGLTLLSLKEKNYKDAAICKILNPDGTIGICRKGELFFNLQAQAFMHFRLNRLFPNSRLFRRALLRNEDFNSTRELFFVAGCFLLMKRGFFLEIGFFDEKFFLYSEDSDLCLRIRNAGGRLFYFTEGELIHWEKGSSAPNSMLPHYYYLSNRYRFFKKHFGLINAVIFRSIVFTSSFMRVAFDIFNLNQLFERKIEIKRNIFTLKWAVGLQRKPVNEKSINYRI